MLAFLERRRSRSAALSLIALALAAAAGTASAEPDLGTGKSSRAADGEAASAVTKAAAKRRHYLSLRQLGVRADRAQLLAGTLTLRVTAKRRVKLSLAVLEGKKVRATARPFSAKKGTRTVTRSLDRVPQGRGLKLRVTATGLGKRGRKTIALKILSFPAPAPGPGSGSGPLLGNRAPTGLALTNSSVAENQPAGTAVGTLSASDPDPGDVLSYSLVAGEGATDNGSFTIAGTTLRSASAFDFESKPSYSVRVRVDDGKGGTLERQFTITVTDVAEGDLSLSGASVAENQPAGTVVGTLSTVGGGSPTYSLVAGEGSTDNAQFQIVGDSLRTSQALNFEAGATRSIRVRSTGGAGGDFERQFTVTVTNVNEAPVADDENLSSAQRAVGNTALVGNDPSDGAPDPPGPQKTVAADLLAGDADPDAGSMLAVTAETKQTNDGGSVQIEADGDFTYRPAAGTSCSDHSDFFDYAVSDGSLSDVGRVTIEIQDCVWYVDASAAGGGDGRSHAPLSSLAAVGGAGGGGDGDAAGHTLFLYDGSYAGGLPLENTQKLFSQRHGLTVPDGGGGSLTLEPAVPGGANSTISGGLTLASDNTIQGIHLGNSAGAALSGTNVGSAVMNTATSGAIDNATGRAVNIATGTLNMVFSAVSSTASVTNGIALTSTSGTFTAAGGTLQNATEADVSLTGGSTNFTYDGVISDDVGQLVSIANQTGGTKDFNGAVGDGGDGDGSGISLSSNNGATVRFDGGLTLSTGANPAFSATGGGTLAVTDPAGADNTIATSTATALNVTGTTISSSNLTFRSIASSGGSSTGIILNSTGSSGGLMVTGDGTAGSGGTIAGKTGADGATSSGVGIYLNSTRNVSLARMALQNFSNFAIRGTGVDGFTLADSVINGVNGDNISIDEASVSFSELTGSASISRSNISGGVEDNVRVRNTGGTLNRLTLDGTTIGPNSQANGNDGVSLEGTAGTFNVTVQNGFFTSAGGDLFQLSAIGAAASNLVFSGNALSNNHSNIVGGGGGVTISSAGSADLTYDITDNTLRDSKGTALLVSKAFGGSPGDATASGRIEGNTIGVSGTANSGSKEGSGIDVIQLARGSHTTLIRNNRIYGYNNFGLLLTAGGAAESVTGVTHDGAFNATVQGNTIAQPGTLGTLSMNGIHLNSGTNSGDGYQLCLQLGDPTDTTKKNTVTGTGALGGTDYRLRQRMDTSVRMPGYTGVANDPNATGTLDTALRSYLTPRTSGQFTLSSASSATGGFFNTAGGAACPTP